MINLVEILDAEVGKQVKLTPHPTNRASEAGHPCVRFLVLSRLKPQERELPSLAQQRIFAEGNLHERDILIRLQQAGINVIEQQRAFEWEKFQLTGYIDAKIVFQGKAVPLEIKSCSPNIFPAIKPLQPLELMKSKQSWIRRYPAQMLLYMFMSESEGGIMLFKNKVSGELVQKVFTLSDEALDYVEGILRKLEKVNQCVSNKEIPPAQWIEECSGCPFRRTACLPDFTGEGSLETIDSTEAEAMLARHEELEPLVKEYEEIESTLKEQFKGRTVVIGSWLVESKPYEMTLYKIPDEIKSQYIVKKQAFRLKIQRLGGEKE